jgi:hypothetical protein
LYDGIRMTEHPTGNGFIVVREGQRPVWVRHASHYGLEVVDIKAF